MRHETRKDVVGFCDDAQDLSPTGCSLQNHACRFALHPGVVAIRRRWTESLRAKTRHKVHQRDRVLERV